MKEEIQRCLEVWKQTLRHYQITRTIIAAEEVQIMRAVQRYGAEFVELALYGARYEAKSERFDPAEYISITRTLHEDKIQKFANIGSRKRFSPTIRQEVQKIKEQLEKEAEEEAQHVDPEKVRDLMQRIKRS